MRHALALALLFLAAPAEALTLTYTVPHKAPAVQEALLAALPAVPRAEVRVESTGAVLQITVPDSVAPAIVDAVVAAHDPTRLSAGEVLAQRRTDAVPAPGTDKLPDPATLDAQIETLFPGMTAPQRTFLKRLSRMVLWLTRERGLD